MYQFYIANESGQKLKDSFCGCINYFTNLEQAIKTCETISKFHKGKYTVNMQLQNLIYKNGKNIFKDFLKCK